MLLRCCLIHINIITLRHFLYLLMPRPTTIYAGSMRSIFHIHHHFYQINHIFIMIILHNDFKRFWCSMLLNACFSSLTSVCEECNNFQDSRQMFVISDFKVFPKILLRFLMYFSRILVYCQFKNYFTFITKKKLYFFLNLQFLLLLCEKGVSPESCLAICYPRASCL